MLLRRLAERGEKDTLESELEFHEAVVLEFTIVPLCVTRDLNYVPGDLVCGQDSMCIILVSRRLTTIDPVTLRQNAKRREQGMSVHSVDMECLLFDQVASSERAVIWALNLTQK